LIRKIVVLAITGALIAVIAYAAPIYRTGQQYITMDIDSLADTLGGDETSNFRDTVGMFSPFGWQTLVYQFILEPSVVTDSGIGLCDTCNLHLMRTHWGATDTLTYDSSIGLPCTLTYVVSNVNDTALIGDWSVDIELADSCNTHTLAVPYKIRWEYKAIPIQ